MIYSSPKYHVMHYYDEPKAIRIRYMQEEINEQENMGNE